MATAVNVGTREVDGVTIVDFSGRITLGEGSVILRNMLRDLASNGKKKILLNLVDVAFIDSAGIGELVRGLNYSTQSGWRPETAQRTQKGS